MTNYDYLLLQNLAKELNYLFQFYDNLAREPEGDETAKAIYKAKADAFYTAYSRLTDTTIILRKH